MFKQCVEDSLAEIKHCLAIGYRHLGVVPTTYLYVPSFIFSLLNRNDFKKNNILA